ncbi:MAG: Dabb family protein [Lachnospiraceae bacterium]|nr:Dabb family protein [Lachnospiraceae bacterium]
MVYHIVMWNFKKDIPEEKKQELKASMAEHLGTLVGQVPGLLSVDFVAEPISSSTHEIALVTTMEKAEDVAVYGSHPAHVAVADTYVRPYVCDRACLDYEP